MQKKKYNFFLVGNFIVVIFLSFFLYLFQNQFNSFEENIIDKKFLLKYFLNKSPTMSSEIIHINIDDFSKVKLKENKFWSKKNDSEIFYKISMENSSIVLCDLLYMNTHDTIGNKHLVHSIKKCDNVISPFVVEYGEQVFE